MAATELPSDLRSLMAALVFPIKAVIDKGLKEIQTKKNPAGANASQLSPQAA